MSLFLLLSFLLDPLVEDVGGGGDVGLVEDGIVVGALGLSYSLKQRSKQIVCLLSRRGRVEHSS